jgi:hypothetical protein
MIDSGTVERLEKLIKLLTSDKDGEVVAAARAIRRTLENANSDIHELASRLKDGGLSEAEMRKIYEAGRQAERDERDAAETNIKFTDVEESGSHVDMAKFCVERDRGHLTPWERNFAEEMIHWRRPSEKQLAILLRIYCKQKKRWP